MSRASLSLSHPYVQETLLISALQGAKQIKAKTVKTGGAYVHKSFITCVDYVDDPYWKKVLTDAARGKFLTGFFFDGTTLTYKRKNNLELSQDPRERALQFVTFHQKHGAWSAIDMRNNAQYYDHYLESRSKQETWKAVSKSALRKAELIRKYVDTKFPGLHSKVQEQLITQINVFIDLKLIKPDEIQFNGSEIYSINWLGANNDGVFPMKELPLPKISKSKETKNKTNISVHMENWIKFLKCYLNDFEVDILNRDITSKLNMSNFDDDEDAESYSDI